MQGRVPAPPTTAVPDARSMASSTYIGSDSSGAGSTISSGNGTGSSNGTSSLTSAQPVQPPTPVSTQALPTDRCKHWQKGFCKWESRCRFAHVGGPVTRVHWPLSPAGTNKLLPTAACAGSGLNAGGVSATLAGLSLATEGDPESAQEKTEALQIDSDPRWVWRRPPARLYLPP